MKQLSAIFSPAEMFYCSVPVPPINDHKRTSFNFTAEQIAAYGQSQIHPSIWFFPNGWNGHKYWLATTPYPHSVAVFENACIYYGDEDGEGNPPRVFTPISGTASGVYTVINNPVVKIASNTAINSDPDLLYDEEEDALYLVTRDNNSPGYADAAYVQVSKDGQSWTPREDASRIIDTRIKCGGGQPSWLKVGGKFRFWYTSGGASLRNLLTGQGMEHLDIIEGTSIDDIDDYAYVRRCDIKGKSNIYVYHSDVFVDESTGYYYLITCAYNYDTDTPLVRQIYLAESKDGGNTWYMFARPLLASCDMCNGYYRPTAFVRQSDRMLVVYWSTTSGIKKDASLYPNGASDVPVDNSTIGLSFKNFDEVLAVLRNDYVNS